MSARHEEAKEVLQASLFLSVLKHTGNGLSDGDEAARSQDDGASSSRAPPRVPRRSNPPIVRRVNALIDSMGQCWGPFEKRVMASDLNEQQNRLILWKEDVRQFVLPLLGNDDNPAQGVEVTVFNPEGKTVRMRFKLWCGKVYVLMGNWKVFVKENQLTESHVLKIWAFRDVRTRGLCFVIAHWTPPKAVGQSRTEKGTRRRGQQCVESKPQKALLSG